MNFGDALRHLEAGDRVARSGWNGKNMWLRRIDLHTDPEFRVVETPDSVGTWMPFIVLKTVNNHLVPWQPSQEDMRSDDWVVVTL